MVEPNSGGRLLTPREAADFLRVSESWLAKARMRGDGPPYVKVGRSGPVAQISSATVDQRAVAKGDAALGKRKQKTIPGASTGFLKIFALNSE